VFAQVPALLWCVRPLSFPGPATAANQGVRPDRKQGPTGGNVYLMNSIIISKLAESGQPVNPLLVAIRPDGFPTLHQTRAGEAGKGMAFTGLSIRITIKMPGVARLASPDRTELPWVNNPQNPINLEGDLCKTCSVGVVHPPQQFCYGGRVPRFSRREILEFPATRRHPVMTGQAGRTLHLAKKSFCRGL
jgi:hypothetical protein